MSDVFTLRARLAAPPEAVYRALTDPAALRTWLAEQAEVSLPEGRFEFWGRSVPGGERGRQRLLAAEPDRLLRFAWLPAGEETVAEIRLEPRGPNDTALTLTQSGASTFEELVAGLGDRPPLHDFWRLSIANLASHLEGRELAPRHDFSRSRRTEARVEIDIDAPPERVYASLIEPEQLNRWIAGDAEVDPRVGGHIAYSRGATPMKILELEPGRALAHTWGFGGHETVVRWELEGSGGRTHLTVVHSGWSEERPTDADQTDAGWGAFLAELKRMHELGAAWHRIEFELPQ
jgi:uncharacterized protein YndB with AHSA1/START domain